MRTAAPSVELIKAGQLDQLKPYGLLGFEIAGSVR